MPGLGSFSAAAWAWGEGGAEASRQLLGVEERLGDFPFSLARGPGFEASLDAWKIAGHAAQVSFVFFLFFFSFYSFVLKYS